ncbi:MAG: glycoside hydrolase family 13 protein [Bacteroidales bacterium]|jgi:glycosidase
MRKIRLILGIVIVCLATGATLYAQEYVLDKVEPPFWYTGMKHRQLQLMVHGKNVGELEPVLQYKGIKIDSIVRVANLNYLFIYLNISPNTKNGSFLISFNKGQESRISYNYVLDIRDPGSASRTGFNNSDAIYLITPDRFANGDPLNDNMPGMHDKSNRSLKNGRHGGDLKGVIAHLDYISNMGFTALWLNPVLENNQLSVSYHGYAMTDFYKTDPRFGTNGDYLELSRQCKKRGMKLIMDQVMNHCGSEHWWMKDLPTPDWIHNGNKFTPTNHRRSTLNDPYASPYDRNIFVNGWFVPTMPDMNQENRLLSDYLIQNSIWWIEYAGLSGIRHDTHPYAGKEFTAGWTCRILDEYPFFNIVGEEWSEDPAIIAKWQKGKQNPDGYTSCLPSLMDFPMQMSLSKALTEPDSWNTGFIRLYEMLANDFLYQDPYNLVVFPDNHDVDRFYTQMKNDLGLFKLGIAYFLTIRGIPQILYGTEILMSNSNPGDHGLIRSDFPGGWAGDVIDGFTGSGLDQKQAESQHFIKTILNWRKANPVIHTGKLMHYSPVKGLYVYFRYDNTRKVMVVLNKSGNAVGIDPSMYPEMLKEVTLATDIITGKTGRIDNLIIPAKSPAILEIEI